MATLYYNAAVDSDWATLGNWWTDDAFTTQASSLPTSSDSVVLSGGCSSNSGSEPTVVNFTMNDPGYSYAFGISITVTGNATFNGTSAHLGTINGSATFSGAARMGYNSSNSTRSVVNGDVTLNGNSQCAGDIYGNAVVNEYAEITWDGMSAWPYPYGRVHGDLQANDYAVVRGGYYSGTFRDYSVMAYSDADYQAPQPYNAHMLDNSTVNVSMYVSSPFYFYGNSFNASYLGTYTRTPPERGINGSSILGVL